MSSDYVRAWLAVTRHDPALCDTIPTQEQPRQSITDTCGYKQQPQDFFVEDKERWVDNLVRSAVPIKYMNEFYMLAFVVALAGQPPTVVPIPANLLQWFHPPANEMRAKLNGRFTRDMANPGGIAWTETPRGAFPWDIRYVARLLTPRAPDRAIVTNLKETEKLGLPVVTAEHSNSDARAPFPVPPEIQRVIQLNQVGETTAAGLESAARIRDNDGERKRLLIDPSVSLRSWTLANPERVDAVVKNLATVTTTPDPLECLADHAGIVHHAQRLVETGSGPAAICSMALDEIQMRSPDATLAIGSADTLGAYEHLLFDRDGSQEIIDAAIASMLHTLALTETLAAKQATATTSS